MSRNSRAGHSRSNSVRYNNEMQRTEPGQNGASPLISVLSGPRDSMSRTIGLVAIATCGVVSCSTLVRDSAFEVVTPLAEARIHRESLFVTLAPDVPMSMVVAVPLGSLQPGLTLPEAERALGQPVATRSDAEGVYYRFASGSPNVELAHLSGPGSGGSRWEKWSVVAAPAGRFAISAVFREPLEELLQRAAPVTEVTVHEHHRGAKPIAFNARLERGVFTRLEWYSIADMPPEMKEALDNKEMQRTRPAQATPPRR